jgi:peptide/nickel transport system ATP-binding protein
MAMTVTPPVLAIRDLRLAFHGGGGESEVLHGISLHVNAGEKVALVGESGSGKSVTARLAMGLLQGTRGVRISGSILFTGTEIVRGGPEIADLRGTRVTMIFQDPTSALNPTFTIRNQFRRVLHSGHPKLSGREADAMAEAGLADVQIEHPRRVLDSYAFQLSGGMNQRVMIAMALISRPALLIADEPGTALDVTVQAQTLKLMHDLTERTGTAVLLISHNLGVVREFADRVYVIYRGSIVEHGLTRQLFRDPHHPYTRALLSAVPRITGGGLPKIPDRSAEFEQPLFVHDGCGEPGGVAA